MDLQATAKTHGLLGKQHRKVTNSLTMDWKDVPAFYKTPLKKNNHNTFGFAFTHSDRCSCIFLRHIYKKQIKEKYLDNS